jgi:CopG family transcriptional regulator, nickel-responsive regulator
VHYADAILSTQQYDFEGLVNLEIIAVKGPASRLTELSDKVLGLKGVQHGKLVMSKAG